MSPRHGTPRTVRPRPVLRVYETARTAHLERLGELAPSVLLYRSAHYDFDDALLEGTAARRSGRLRSAVAAARHRGGVVEINEPAYLQAWPGTLAVVTAVRLARALGAGPRRVVAYAIENGDPVEVFRRRTRTPAWLAQAVVGRVCRYIAGSVDRLAFGTAGAEQAYARLGVRHGDGLTARQVPAVPAPCTCPPRTRTASLVFLGAFEDRKGIRELMRAYERLEATGPVRLTLVGQGELTDEVRAWAADRPLTTVLVDPPRSRIHGVLREGSVLVLLSQRTDRWREQVGLPLLEGLAHGCEVVATTETGIADWLADHGHAVLDPASGVEPLVAVLRARLASARDAREVLGALPAEDGRVAADRWMLS